jgi:hypothetical protein
VLLAGCDAPKRTIIAPSPPLRLDGVNVVDPRDDTIAKNVNILMRNGKIIAVGTKAVMPAGDATVIDAAGRYVVPGYNDMHVHSLTEDDREREYALMLANRVPGFRQMGGSAYLLKARALFASKIKQLLVNPTVEADPSDIVRLRRALDSFDPDRCAGVARAFAANSTWHMARPYPNAPQDAGVNGRSRFHDQLEDGTA